jgi:hypothetical protein
MVAFGGSVALLKGEYCIKKKIFGVEKYYYSQT